MSRSVRRSVIWLNALLAAMSVTGLAQDGRVRVVRVKPMDAPEVQVFGRVVPLQMALVGARVAGRIATWGTAEGDAPIDIGSRVKAGQELFRLEKAPFEVKLAAQKAALALAEAQLSDMLAGTRPERITALEAAVAQIDVTIEDLKHQEERYRRLVETDKTVPARKLEEIQEQIAASQASRRAALARLAEAKAGATPSEVAIARARVAEAASHVAVAQLDHDDATVKAPFDGVVTRKIRGLGDYVNSTPFVEVLELVSDRNLEAEMRMAEAWFPYVVSGTTTVTLTSPLLPGPVVVPFNRIVAAIDKSEGVFIARAAIPADKRGRLVAGAFIEGTLPNPGARGRLLVPAAAVVAEPDGSVVFVARDGRMQKAKIKIAERLSDGVVISSGLLPEDKVVIGPRPMLVEGSALPADAETN